tara:strand:- start:451 stop:963 length:513 start_codon:yes stop_codon:yes gene_type:complete
MAVKSLIETVTVGAGGVTSIVFSNIAQEAGSDLLVVCSTRSNAASVVSNIRLYVNGETGGTYPIVYITGNGSSVTAGLSDYSFAGRMNGANSTAGTFTNTEAFIYNYTTTGVLTMGINSAAENNATEGLLYMGVQGENTGGPVTSIRVQTSDSDTIQHHSTVSLYLIKYD